MPAMQQSGIQFLPGKISTSKYERRLDQCTKQQLSLLLTSPEYLDWQKQQQHDVQNSSASSRTFSRRACIALLSFLLLVPALLAPHYISSVKQVSSATRQQQSIGHMDSPLISHEQYIDTVNPFDSRIPVAQHLGSAFGHDAPHLPTEEEMHTAATLDTHHEGVMVADTNLADSRPAVQDASSVQPGLSDEMEGPHPWFGDMQLVYPSAAFGMAAAVAAVASLIMHCKHHQAIITWKRHVKHLKFQLLQAMNSKEEADSEIQGLQQQLEKMQEVQGQLESTAKALQGRTELQEEEIEVLRMDLLAKDTAGALQQALADSQPDLPLAAQLDAKVDLGAPEQGPPLTPAQPAPSDNAAETGPEAEMSFTDLIDDSGEDQGTRSGGQSLATVVLAEGQVVVDAEDVDVRHSTIICNADPAMHFVNWADMEREYRAVQAECGELQSVLDQKEDQLCSLSQELVDLSHRMQNEVNGKDDTVKDLRLWLNQAQGQLQNTQAALHEREADCKTLAADLKDALADLAALKERAASGVECSEEEAVAVLKQGLRDSNFALEACQDQVRLREEEVQDLSQHLQAAQADISSLQAQLGAAEAREGALAREHEAVQGALTGQVAGVMHMMRGLRMSLSSKLTHSQTACQALMQDLAAQNSFADDMEGGSGIEHSQGTRQSLSSGAGMNSFSAFTPGSTLALTASGMEAPGSDVGSVAGPLALTPIRRMDLASAGPFELTPEAVTANSATPESMGGSVGGPLALTPSPLPAKLPVLDTSADHDHARASEASSTRELAYKDSGAAQSADGHNEEERENVPPQGTPPSVRKAMAVKRVQDSYMRLGRWNLVAFLKEMGCNAGREVAPVTQAEFDHVKDNGLRALHPSNHQGKDEVHRAAAAEARAIVEAWQWPVPKVCLKPNSPYWFAR